MLADRRAAASRSPDVARHVGSDREAGHDADEAVGRVRQRRGLAGDEQIEIREPVSHGGSERVQEGTVGGDRELGCFDERFDVLEDQELVRRLRRRWRFVVLDRAVVAFSRRYNHHGVYRTQLVVYPALVALYRLHLPPGVLGRASRRLLASR